MEDMKLNCALPEGIVVAESFFVSPKIKCGSVWRGYNSASNAVETLDGQWVRDEKASIEIVKKPEKGSLIIYKDEGYFVERPLAKCVIAFHAESGQRRIVPPTKTEEGLRFYKVITWFELARQHPDEVFPRKYSDAIIAYSFEHGSAIKCGEYWRIYCKETRKVVDLHGVFSLTGNINDKFERIMQMEAIRLNRPVLYNSFGSYIFPVVSPEEGVLIKHDGEHYFAVRKIENGIEALNVNTNEVKIIPPTKTIEGERYWQVSTIEAISCDPQSGEFKVGLARFFAAQFEVTNRLYFSGI